MYSYTTDGGWQLIVTSFQCCLDCLDVIQVFSVVLMHSYTTDGGWQLIVASFQCCLDAFIYNRRRVATNSNKFSVLS